MSFFFLLLFFCERLHQPLFPFVGQAWIDSLSVGRLCARISGVL